MGDLGAKIKMSMIQSNSQSAIMLAKNLVFHAMTKHIEVKYHFKRYMLEDKIMKLFKVHTNDNLANLLTKGLPPKSFAYCRTLMGVK